MRLRRVQAKHWGWLAASAAALALVGGALAPPLVEGAAGAAVRQAFAPVCHQMPSRSFAIGGQPLAVCHRCFGIYVGLLAGTLAWPLLAARAQVWVGRRAGLLIVAAGGPAALDWLAGVAGLWANTPASRTATGGLLGVALGLIFARATAQATASRRGRKKSVTRPREPGPKDLN